MLHYVTRTVLLLSLSFAFLAAGCSTFNRDWQRAAAEPISTRDMEGPWQGTWMSDVNGHNDRLRCLISKKADQTYQARFHAKYRKVLSFGYTVVFDVQKTNDLFKFRSEADLGWLAGGRYYYEGQATLTNFFSTYRSKYDHGTFKMTRP